MGISTCPSDLKQVLLGPAKFMAARDMNSGEAQKDALKFLIAFATQIVATITAGFTLTILLSLLSSQYPG